jgi:hypothetical protein
MRISRRIPPFATANRLITSLVKVCERQDLATIRRGALRPIGQTHRPPICHRPHRYAFSTRRKTSADGAPTDSAGSSIGTCSARPIRAFVAHNVLSGRDRSVRRRGRYRQLWGVVGEGSLVQSLSIPRCAQGYRGLAAGTGGCGYGRAFICAPGN